MMHRTIGARTARSASALALLLSTAACDLFATSPDFPADAERLEPPAHFAYWWSLVEQCAGRTARFSSVQWFTRFGAIPVRGEWYDGYWWEDGNRIVLAAGNEDDGGIVRHEMLHAILGEGGHPLEYFADRCDALVSCPNCFPSDAGVPRDEVARAVEVSSDILHVTIEEHRPDPRFGLEPTWVDFTVRVANPHPTPVWVRVRSGRSLGFVIDVPTEGGEFEWELDERVFFRAGQERSHRFDYRFCEPGAYPVYGFYDQVLSDPLSVEITAPGDSLRCRAPDLLR